MSFPKVVTNGGNWAIVYAINSEGDQPIHGAYWTKKEWLITAWDKYGFRHSSECLSDLDISNAIKRGELNGLFPQEEGQKETSGTI